MALWTMASSFLRASGSRKTSSRMRALFMAPEISIISGPKAWRMAGTAAPPAAVTAREMRSASMMGSPSSRKMSAAVLFPEPAPPVAVQESKPAAAAAPVAQVYVRMREGEKLKLNGEPHNTQPATNGFASLKLAPGHYEITLQGNGQTREQTLEIAKPGTWLINPSS